MSDRADFFDELLLPSPISPDPAFRDTLRRRTSRLVRLQWWLMRLGILAAFAAVYFAGWLTPRTAEPPLQPSEPPTLVSPVPFSPPTPEAIASVESAVELEYRALESDHGRAALYRTAGDRYLSQDDLASATRCYRLALDAGLDAIAYTDDTWLLLAIKNARMKEKPNAKVHR